MPNDPVPESAQAVLLKTALEPAVMLYALEFRRKSWEELLPLVRQANQDLQLNAEYVLFPSKKPGRTAAGFNALARALAVLSFAPGGVTLFGLHFENKLEEDHAREESREHDGQ
jgi:hypothetical protein